MAQILKRLPAMRETWVRPLGREGPLEKEMATHSSTLAWKIPWTEEPGIMQDLNSIRDRTHTPNIGSMESLITGPPGKF